MAVKQQTTSTDQTNIVPDRLQNHSLKEDIRAYWSARSSTFDQSVGHRIEDGYELPEWQALFRSALCIGVEREPSGKQVLDVACGTGEISRVLLSLGASVTAIDFSEDMLERAKLKNAAALNDKRWAGMLADAEDLT